MTFNLGALFVGLIILITGGLMVIFHRPIAENIAHGVSDYDRIKLYGVITIAIGFLVMTNLHIVILSALVNLIFP